MIRVGIVGLGLIGIERLQAISMLMTKGRPVSLAGVFDVNAEHCAAVARTHDTQVFESLESLLACAPDWVVISLPHDAAVLTALEVLNRSRSKVLLEKPMGRDLHEAEELLAAGGDRLTVGFNYRYYAGIRRALQDVRAGRFGRLISVDLALAHGCSPGQEITWKLNSEKAGGGCLIDPGVHILDLCSLIFPNGLDLVGGSAWSGFWNTGVEEDVALMMSCAGVSVSLRTSIVRWRSTFELGIHGTEAYGIVSGRNRSYGRQTYVVGPRWGWRSAPSQAAAETLETESEGTDVFVKETDAILFPEIDGNAEWPAPATAIESMSVMVLLDLARKRLGLDRHPSRQNISVPSAPRISTSERNGRSIL